MDENPKKGRGADEDPKGQTGSGDNDSGSKPSGEGSYYYDDAYGYQNYNPEETSLESVDNPESNEEEQ